MELTATDKLISGIFHNQNWHLLSFFFSQAMLGPVKHPVWFPQRLGTLLWLWPISTIPATSFSTWFLGSSSDSGSGKSFVAAAESQGENSQILSSTCERSEGENNPDFVQHVWFSKCFSSFTNEYFSKWKMITCQRWPLCLPTLCVTHTHVCFPGELQHVWKSSSPTWECLHTKRRVGRGETDEQMGCLRKRKNRRSSRVFLYPW